MYILFSLVSCLFILLSLPAVYSQCQPRNSPFLFPPTTGPGLAASLVFSNLSTPRGIAFDSFGTLLVIERGIGVSAFIERNDTICNGFERTLVVNNSALTHGIILEGEELYVSSQLQVLLYHYDVHMKTVSASPPKVIVDDLPSDGGE